MEPNRHSRPGDLSGMQKALRLLEQNPSVDLFILEQLYWRLPAWLISRQQLFPGPELSNKLSNLYYQLNEFVSGRAIDIEDFYLFNGIPQADLTYNDNNKLVFIDITTSHSPNVLKHKETRILSAAAEIGAIGRVLIVPKTHRFVYDRAIRSPVDVLDSFNKMLLSLDSSEQATFVSLMTSKIVPAVKREILNSCVESAKSPSDPTISGNLGESFEKHPSCWTGVNASIRPRLEQVVKNIKVHNFKTPITIPIPKEPIVSTVTLQRHTDPLVAVINWLATEPDYVSDVALELELYPTPRWKVLIEDSKEAASFFRYHGKGAVRAQRDAIRDPRPFVLYIMVSSEKVRHPSGIEFPKGFSLAVGSGWAGYGAEHMIRGFNDHDLGGLISAESEPLTLEKLDTAQVMHDNLVNFLSSPLSGSKSPIVPKLISASKLTNSIDWASMFQGAVPSQSGGTPVNCNLIHVLGFQYEIARVITSVLSEKRINFRYRICFPAGGSHVLAVGTGNGISRMKDVPVGIWTQTPLAHPAIPRSRNRSLSLSSRLLGWWIKLPFVFVSRSACAVQHNLALPSKHPLSDSLESVVEHISMHLGTRQQESLMQDQTRYVLAGLYSYEPEPIGPLAKVENVILYSPSAAVYWARLCRLQVMAFLTKSGLASDLKLREDSPPNVVPPQHSTLLSTHGMYVDAMFDSKLFNKDQDYKTASQALDWKGLLSTEKKYRTTLEADPLSTLGMTHDALQIFEECIQLKSVAPILADLVSQNSSLIESATTGWNEKTKQGKRVDFTWNAVAFYALAANYFKGARISDKKEDYFGVFPDLGDQSLTSFLSSSGSTEKGDVTLQRQSVRKSTAMLGFLADSLSSESIPYSEVGTWLHKRAVENPNQYQSLLVAGLTVLRHNGGMRLVSRTETKEQSGGGREFSAMNAAGIVTCRLTERVFSSYLPSMPTDRMTDPHAEMTLHNLAVTHTSNRKFCIAADNSRFGPNQIMSKSRALIAMLCLTDSMKSTTVENSLLLYDLLSESTRLMESKISKMPHELLEFFQDQGGILQVLNHNPNSTLGHCASLMKETLGWNALKPGFEQKWGMYQGALGMLSSCASSMLHDVFTSVLIEAKVVESARALVTNDDSAIFVGGVTDSLSMREASLGLKSSLRYTLALGGQILNPFKTVVSSYLSEFHSTFSTSKGLICPELKILAASISAGRGEIISDDAKAPVESGISAIRQGVSLFNATTLSICNTVLHCDQYNRWPSLKKHGPRPAALGGPIVIDLTKELLLPGFGDLALYAPLFKHNSLETVATMIAEGAVSLTDQGLLELEQAGTIMVTRRIYKQSRGNKEVDWTRPVVSMPMSGPPALGTLVTAVTTGLLRDTREQGQDRLLVRMGRNAVSKTNKNLRVGENSWLARLLGSSSLSYEDLDSVDLNSVKLEPTELLSGTKMHTFVDSFKYWLQAAEKAAASAPSLRLLLRSSPIKQEELLVSPFTIRDDKRLPASWSLTTAIRQWGTLELKKELLEHERLNFDSGNYKEDLHTEVRQVTATSMAFSRLAKQRTGPFMAPMPPFAKTTQAEAALFISKHVFRGLITTVPEMDAIITTIAETMVPPPEIEEPERERNLWDVISIIKRGRVPADTVGPLEPGLLITLLDLAESGWFSVPGGRTKIKRLGKPLRQYGRNKWKPAFLITVQTTSYEHFVVGMNKDESPHDYRGWPLYLERAIPAKVEYLSRHQLSTLDSLVFLSEGNFSSAAVVSYGTNVICKLPIVSFGLRRKVIRGDQRVILSSSESPTSADWFVWLSLGELRPSDTQVKQVSEVSDLILTRLAHDYRSTHILNAWKTGQMLNVPGIVNKEAWESAASKIASAKPPNIESASEDLITWDDVEDFEVEEIELDDRYEVEEVDVEDDFHRTLVDLGLAKVSDIFTESVFLLEGERMNVEEALEQGYKDLMFLLDDDEFY